VPTSVTSFPVPNSSVILFSRAGSNAIVFLLCLGNRRHDGDQNSVRLQYPKRPLLLISSNRIKGNVHSRQQLVESLSFVVHNSFRSQVPRVLEIASGSGTDHMKASLAGQLYGISANIARGPVDQHSLPGSRIGISKSICQAVTATIGTDAASMKLRCFGFGAILPANGSAYSAYAPLHCSFVAP